MTGDPLIQWPLKTDSTVLVFFSHTGHVIQMHKVGFSVCLISDG